MKKLLISTARSGSTCAYKKLLANKNIDIDTVEHAYHPAGEWINPIYYTYDEICDNILFLVEERSYGREYSWKALAVQFDRYNLRSWIKSFYNENEIYILKRRNTWKHYLSYMYQESVEYDSAGLVKTSEPHKVYRPMVYNDYIEKTEQFFNDLRRLDDFNYGEIIYYEDHDWGNKTKILSNYVDYEKHFINFEELKNQFDAQYSMYKQTL